MPKHASVRFDITLEFPGETRTSEYHPAQLNVAIDYALDFARKNRGVRILVSLNVPVSPIHAHSYTLFECRSPVLEPFMRANIQRHFGCLPE